MQEENVICKKGWTCSFGEKEREKVIKIKDLNQKSWKWGEKSEEKFHLIQKMCLKNLPRMKKLAGSDLSDKLLYVKSRTSSDGKAPNPRGKVFNRFILSSWREEGEKKERKRK